MTPDEALKLLSERRTAFQLAFGTPAGKAVLDDLTIYCHVKETCVVIGDRDLSYVFEGRRQVFLHIREYLDQTVEELATKYIRPAKGAISHDDRTYPSDPA